MPRARQPRSSGRRSSGWGPRGPRSSLRPHANRAGASTSSVLRLLRPRTDNPWNALWALLVGFFMILLDATIVAVANPSIMDALDVDYDSVIWVTSAYLLAYAVPLLLAGRVGDPL